MAGGTQYLFAVGRVKAKEEEIIDAGMWQRLIDAESDEALRLLKDHGYGESGEETSAEAMIASEMTKTAKFIAEISPEPAFTDLFLFPIDGYNLKLMLKGIVMRKDVTPHLREGGAIAIQRLQRAVESDAFDGLPKAFARAIKTLETETDARVISTVVDQAVYDAILDVLSEKKHDNALLNRYFKAKIDHTNILSVIRAGALGYDEKAVSRLLIDGGDMDKAKLLSAVSDGEDHGALALAGAAAEDGVKKALARYAERPNIGMLEQALDRASLSIISSARGDVFGIAPLLYFRLMKEREGKMLRMLFAAKRGNVPITAAELGVKEA